MDNVLELLVFPLSNLNLVGVLISRKLLKPTHVISFFMLFLIWVQIVIMIMQYFYMTDEVMDYMKNTEGFAYILQTALKWNLCIYYKNKYMHLINMTKDFWSTENCSTVTQDRIKSNAKVIKFLQKLHASLAWIVFVLGTLLSLLLKDILNGSWNMENDVLFKIYWIIAMANSLFLFHFGAAHDGFFLGLSYEAIFQCRVLCNYLDELNVSKINSKEDLKKYHQKINIYNDHFKFLLRFQKEFQDVFSIPLMCQYLGTAPLICAELYMLTYVSGFYIIRHGIALTCAVVEASIYCIAAQNLSDELSSISDAVYNSDWYSKNIVGIRTPFVLMIQRSQRIVVFTACGLIQINIDTLVKMFKLAVSTWVTLKNFKK